MKLDEKKVGIILSYSNIIVSTVISLVYTPIMLRELGKSEYALVGLANSITSYISLLNLGLGSSYIRYNTKYRINHEKDKEASLNGLYLVLYLIISALIIVSGILVNLRLSLIFGDSLSQEEYKTLHIIFFITVLELAFSIPLGIFMAYINSREKFIFIKSTMLLSSVCSPLVKIVLLLNGYKSIGFVTSTFFINISLYLIYVYYATYKLNIRFKFRDNEKGIVKSIFSFSVYVFIYQLVDQLNWNIDRIILGIVSGTNAIAIYQYASQFSGYFWSFSSAVSGVFVPKINQLVLKENKKKEIQELFVGISRTQLIILWLLFSGAIVFGKQFMILQGGEEYTQSYLVMIVLFAAQLVPFSQLITIEIQRAYNKHRFRSVICLFIAILNFFISIPLAKSFGALGSALGTLGATVLGHVIILNIYFHKKLYLNVWKYWISFCHIGFLVIILTLISSKIVSLFELKSYSSIFSLAFVYAIIYMLIVWLFFMDFEEKNRVLRMLKLNIYKK